MIMTSAIELQNRITWLVECSIPIFQQFAKIKDTLPVNAKDICAAFLKDEAVFNGEKCCTDCKHNCNICLDMECKSGATCLKLPCSNCSSTHSKCSKELLLDAVFTVYQLFKLQSHEDFARKCKEFGTEKKLFAEFPHCKTWEQLWQNVDDSLSILNEFLKKNGKVDKNFEADRKMWQRMVLSLDFDTLQYNFKSSIPNVDDDIDDDESVNKPYKASEVDEILTEEEKQKKWTYEDLETLIKTNDARKIRAIYNYLPYAVDLFIKGDQTLPLVADESNAIDVIKVFIEHGFDALELIADKKNVFHWAAELGHLDILQDLISYEPNGVVTLCNDGKNTPLEYACIFNQVAIIDFLLQLPNSVDENHFLYSIKSAIINHNVDCVERMLQSRQCKVNVVHDNSSLLSKVCEEGYADSLKLLLQHPNCDVNAVASKQTCALFKAIKNRHVECVDLLVQHPYIDINMTNEPLGKVTSLFLATEMKQVECMRILLKHSNCEVNEFVYGKSALHQASGDGFLEGIKLLLKHPKCNVNLKTDERNRGRGTTALSFAVKNIECFKELLNHPDCDINIQDKDGDTALHYACYARSDEVIMLLLQHKDIKFNLMNHKNETALSRVGYYYEDESSPIHKLYKKIKDCDEFNDLVQVQ